MGVHARRGGAEESGRSATVQVPLKHRATRENQNRDSCSHTRSGAGAGAGARVVDALAGAKTDEDDRTGGGRRGRSESGQQHFINDQQ